MYIENYNYISVPKKLENNKYANILLKVLEVTEDN
jgi:hypothetical protein